MPAELKQIANFSVRVRPDDVDESVAAGVLAGKMGYEKYFAIEPFEHWIDLGGHIGSFALLCHLRGSRALVSVEPAPDNFKLLEENLRINNVPTEPLEAAVVGNGQTVLPLYLHEQKPKVYRNNNSANHSLFNDKPANRPPNKVEVQCVDINDLLSECTPLGPVWLKVDIEGAESEVLCAIRDWSPIKKLAMEYHFYGPQRQLDKYHSTLEILRNRFPNVRCNKTFRPEITVVDFWPNLLGMVWAW
jgi:FkbM family methyltransferase